MKDYKSKFKATTSHFLISLILLTSIMTIAVLAWYPYDLYLMENLLTGILIASVVDLIIGPTLTFIIFDKTKTLKTLCMDFSIIAILQLGALGYGCNLFYQQSPAAIAYFNDTFFITNKASIKKQKVELPHSDTLLGHIPLYQVDYAKEVKDIIHSNTLNDQGIPVYEQAFLFEALSYENIISNIITRTTEDLADALKEYPIDSHNWKLAQGKEGFAAIIFNSNNHPIDFIKFNED